MNTFMRVGSVLAVFSLMGCAVTGYHGPTEPVQLEFHYKRTDLQTPEGAERVYRRLHGAARQTCTKSGTPMEQARNADTRCIADLVEKVVTAIGSAQLAGVHQRATTGAGVTGVSRGTSSNFRSRAHTWPVPTSDSPIGM